MPLVQGLQFLLLQHSLLMHMGLLVFLNVLRRYLYCEGLGLDLIYTIKSHYAMIFQASVPNWLREEIKKAVIAAPSVEHPKEETKFMDDDADKSYMKGDEPDSKSNDSSRSVEEEEDEEVSLLT